MNGEKPWELVKTNIPTPLTGDYSDGLFSPLFARLPSETGPQAGWMFSLNGTAALVFLVCLSWTTTLAKHSRTVFQELLL